MRSCPCILDVELALCSQLTVMPLRLATCARVKLYELNPAHGQENYLQLIQYDADCTD